MRGRSCDVLCPLTTDDHRFPLDHRSRQVARAAAGHVKVQLHALQVEQPRLGVGGQQRIEPLDLRVAGIAVADGKAQRNQFVAVHVDRHRRYFHPSDFKPSSTHSNSLPRIRCRAL